MNGLFKSALLRGAVGFALGMLTSVAILCWVWPGALAGEAVRPVAFILSGGLYGALGMGTTVMYDIERWSITRATATHLLVTLGGLYALGFAQGWLAPTAFGFLVPTLGFIVLYIVIWVAQCLSFRRKVSQMNRGVKAWKSLQRAQPPSDGAQAPASVRHSSKEAYP